MSRHSAARPAGGRILELESVRGVAAFLVVLFHVPAWDFDLYHQPIIRNAYLMVDLFFVLSGFVIYNAYGTRLDSGRDILRFQFLRFGRLYPVHLLFLLVYLAIELAKYFAQTRLHIVSANSTPFKENSAQAFAEQLLLVQAIGPTHNSLSFNGPAWSISVEFYTYLIFAAVVWATGRAKHFVFGALLVTAMWLLFGVANFGFNELLRCVTGFFLGTLTAALCKDSPVRLHPFYSLAAFVALIALLALHTGIGVNVTLYLASAALVLSITLSRDGWFRRVLNWPVLTWLGTISYSLYMSHFAVLWVTNQLLRALFKPSEVVVSGISTPQLSLVQALGAYAFAIAAILAVSQLSYRFVEKPFRERSRRALSTRARA
jgi:peptidoglycan/LPS O-acetylase OafA/YrhL